MDNIECSDRISSDIAIRTKLALYSRGLDRFDPDIWKTAWHPDAMLHYETGSLDGVAHDMSLLMTFGHYNWAITSHQSTRTSIRINGDTAVSETLNMAILHGFHDSSGRSVQDHYRGRYLDRWSRRDGVWAIDSRFTPRGCMWQQTVEAQIGAFTRRGDRRDPSYQLLASIEVEDGRNAETLLAQRAIRRQLQNYCHALDRLDSELLKSVWHTGGTVVDTYLGDEGVIDDLSDDMIRRYRSMSGFMNQNTNIVIKVSRDSAVSETYYNNIMRSPASSPGGCIDHHVWGRYLDSWSKINGRWALDHRDVIMDFAWKQPSS